MIIFQTLDGFQQDLTGLGLTFNEESPYFSNETKSNFVFPFKAPLDGELAIRLGLANIENVSGFKRKIEGHLLVDNNFYDAYLSIFHVGEYDMELRLFYGKEVLAVFNKRMTELPFPIVDTDDDLNTFSKNSLDKTWPEVTHNFPMVRRPEIGEKTDYEAFNGLVNWRSENLNVFMANSNNLVDGELVPKNYNVVAPMPYLLEIFKVAFGMEGLEVRGDFVNHPLIRKLVYIPKKYFEYYSDPTVRSVYSFSTSSNITGTVQTFTRIHNPNKNGTYSLHARLNFPKGITHNFSFSVSYGGKTYYRASVLGEGVNIDEVIEINVSGDQFTPIEVKLVIDRQQRSIKDYTNFVFDFLEGRINAFPQRYSLKEIMPGIKFRTFYDAIVNWLNLDVVFYENSVYINFIEDTVQNLVYDDHSHLEDPKLDRDVTNNNLFKLSYPDGKEVLVTKNGQVFDDTGYSVSETMDNDFDVQPVMVRSVDGVATGQWPSMEAKIVLGIYDGLQGNLPVLVESIDGTDLGIQTVFDNFHKNWLSFRANSELYRDTFFMRASEIIHLRQGIYKYNKKLLVTKLKKRRISEDFWKVDMESESF